jgi:hypothetical protein
MRSHAPLPGCASRAGLIDDELTVAGLVQPACVPRTSLRELLVHDAGMVSELVLGRRLDVYENGH